MNSVIKLRIKRIFLIMLFLYCAYLRDDLYSIIMAASSWKLFGI